MSIGKVGIGKSSLIEMYRKMVLIRRFEEQIWEVYTGGLMKGLAHLYIGEEAVAVGVCSAIRKDDYITSTHRGHGHCIAKGGKVDRMMAEILGKASGYCKGKGGSMHIADMSVGILGANGIVGGGLGIATGAALSAKMRKSDQVAVCFFGDGTANQGILLETANLAVVWKLPVIYVCENNQYGEYTPMPTVTSVKDIAQRADGLGIPGVIVDGNDILEVYHTTLEAVNRARVGDGPTFVECKTYRQRGHHVGDREKYRTDEEIQEWLKRDPIIRLRDKLVRDKIAKKAELDKIDEEVMKEVLEAVEYAKNSPFPEINEVMEDLYA